jgi:hypothetical protein
LGGVFGFGLGGSRRHIRLSGVMEMGVGVDVSVPGDGSLCFGVVIYGDVGNFGSVEGFFA